MNVDIQNKLRNDIVNVMRKYDNKITYETLQSMTYLRKVIDGKSVCTSHILLYSILVDGGEKTRNTQTKLLNRVDILSILILH